MPEKEEVDFLQNFNGYFAKEWLTPKILARDKAMRKEGFVAAEQMKPEAPFIDAELFKYKSFKEFEEKRGK